jgi:hypothetical protein
VARAAEGGQQANQEARPSPADPPLGLASKLRAWRVGAPVAGPAESSARERGGPGRAAGSELPRGMDPARCPPRAARRARPAGP